MPDPSDPTPVSVAKRDDRFVVVDKNGNSLPGQDTTTDSAKASGAAARINAFWKKAKSERRSKGDPEISEAYPFVPRLGQHTSMSFDPSLHPRNRIGEFAKLIGHVQSSTRTRGPRARGRHIHLPGGGMGKIHLPGGVTVEGAEVGDQIRVTGEGGKSHVFHTPEVAAAHALYLSDRASVNPPPIGVRLKELDLAREAAGKEGRYGDQLHVDKLKRKLRQARSVKQVEREQNPELDPALRAYQAAGEVRRARELVPDRADAKAQREMRYHARRMWSDRDSPNVRASLKSNLQGQRGLLQRNLAQAQPHIQLPDANSEADKVRPRLRGNNLQTGYGSYTLQPNKDSQGFYDLALDGQDMGLVGTRRRAQALLARLHDEAMIRHRTSVRTAAMPAGAAFQAARK